MWDLAVLLAPLFGLKIVSPRLLDLTIRLTLLMPDRYVWWDPAAKDQGSGPPHAYPGFSSRALANALLVGRSVVRAARRAAPKARLLVVTAPGDLAVDNRATYALAQRWRARGAFVDTYEFDPALNLQHDFIDPTQPDQQIEVVYPILLDLIARAERR